ncbi:MAG: LacI family transcriptional regulator, partial [Treponema sp.]|nr:LacI family transcriptional regulator [Treponema sp.]
MRATRADVAKKAGVSVATVSYVLNNTCPVKDETRDRVLAAVRVLNYIPDLRARSMATNRTMQIAVIVSSLSDPVFQEVVEYFIH